MLNFTDEEIKEIKKVIDIAYHESWIKEIDNECIKLEYNDSNEMSEIEIRKFFSDSKNKVIYCINDSVVDDKFELEIIHPSACHERCELAIEYGESACEECEKDYVTECDAWTSKKELIITVNNVSLEILNTLMYEKCYVNIPHKHTYKGYIIRFETDNFRKLLEIIEKLLDIEKFLISLKDIFVGIIKKDELIEILAGHFEEYTDEVLLLSEIFEVKNELLKYLRNNKRDVYLRFLRVSV